MFGRDKIKLFTNPTPLQKLENISKELGVELYIKRDDMAFDIGMGGNKLRKLEYLLADAKAKGADNLAGVMLRDLGCVNLVEKYPSLLEELSLESIVTEDPDWIFISVMGGDEEAALSALNASLGANPAFQALTAVREGRMVVLPRELFHYKPNARWSESYACLYDVLFEN